MPVYEYECDACQEVIEIWQSISDEPLTCCPSCSGSMKKIISRSSFQLKGGGWYSDGYSTSSASAPKSCAAEPAAPASCPKTGGTACGGC